MKEFAPPHCGANPATRSCTPVMEISVGSEGRLLPVRGCSATAAPRSRDPTQSQQVEHRFWFENVTVGATSFLLPPRSRAGGADIPAWRNRHRSRSFRRSCPRVFAEIAAPTNRRRGISIRRVLRALRGYASIGNDTVPDLLRAGGSARPPMASGDHLLF